MNWWARGVFHHPTPVFYSFGVWFFLVSGAAATPPFFPCQTCHSPAKGIREIQGYDGMGMGMG